MGTFSVGCKIANHIDRTRAARIPRVLVDAGSESTWIAESTLEKIGVEREKKDLEFIMANGTRITRSVGFALVHVENAFTIDEVVFAENGNRHPLGARSRCLENADGLFPRDALEGVEELGEAHAVFEIFKEARLALKPGFAGDMQRL